MRSLSRHAVLWSTAVATLAAATVPGWTQVPEGSPTDLPVLSAAVPPGTGTAQALDPVTPTAKVVDGDISDWAGTASRYGGTSVTSAGEFIYQDHIFDAHGADDGRDARRYENTDQAEDAIPQAYRIDALAQADLRGELGAPIPDQFAYDDSVGDAASHQDNADLEEVRLAYQGGHLVLLARTTTLNAADQTALVLLVDSVPGDTPREVGFNSGLVSSTAEYAVFLSDATSIVSDLVTGTSSPLPGGAVAVNPDGFVNAVEARIALREIGDVENLNIALAAGTLAESGDSFAPIPLDPGEPELDFAEEGIDAANPPAPKPEVNVANVAFRHDEPVRMWFERDQALALNAGTIDPFFTTFDASKLQAGTTERYVPGPGYHDRIFESTSTPAILQERGRDGLFQHYGVYLPTSYASEPTPLQFWLHWRGGHAHSGAAVVPKVFKQFGEDKDTIVVAPSGRGTSTWYVGRGHVDYREVWKDVTDTFAVDRDRVYVTGHSMGGWGSYLLTLLYPDRFAAAAPVAGPVTQGAWTGIDHFEGCEEFAADDYTPCYISANESRPIDQHTRKLLENSLHVPYAILHGTSDELVPYSGVARQAQRLAELEYRFRFYTYPGYEHYTHPIADQWSEAASYLHNFTRPENPAHVVYRRDMPFEIATEEVQSGGADLSFDFDSAYWMSGLSPVDEEAGTATFDGRSLAIPEAGHIVAPDTGPPAAPGQTGPFAITGMQWLTDPTATTATSNAFEATLVGADAVTLDVARMALDTTQAITGSISTEAPLTLSLVGDWTAAPALAVDGAAAPATLVDGVLTVEIPAGAHEVVIGS